jgi:hypothetical protein
MYLSPVLVPTLFGTYRRKIALGRLQLKEDPYTLYRLGQMGTSSKSLWQDDYRHLQGILVLRLRLAIVQCQHLLILLRSMLLSPDVSYYVRLVTLH